MTEMLVEYLEQAARVAAVWGPLLVFFFMTVESSFVPFPSEVVMIPAGFLAARSEFFPGDPMAALVLAIACGLTGSLIGAYINYGIGWWLGRPFLHRYSRWFFLKPETLDHAEAIFREYGSVATFVCRLLPGIRQLISLPAGISGMKFSLFSFFTGLGAGIWVTILAVIGYRIGLSAQGLGYAEVLSRGGEALRRDMIWILLGCVVIVGAYVWLHRRVMHHRVPSSRGTDAA
jgi:membrane protein DedA with SNARE-associated domain